MRRTQISFAAVIISLVLLALACVSVSPSPNVVLEAIAQTQTAIPTATQTPTQTPTPTLTATPLPTDTPMPSPTVPTQPAEAGAVGEEGMKAALEKLKADGVLTSIEGAYFKLNDFQQESNDVGGVKYAESGHSPADFVIRADASWEVDGGKSNWTTTGPGFAFRQSGDQYLALMASVSGKTFFLFRSGGKTSVITTKEGTAQQTPSGTAKLMLVISGDNLWFYVNGTEQLKGSFPSVSKLQGNIDPAMVSGNASGYGTRVKLTNIELIELKSAAQ